MEGDHRRLMSWRRIRVSIHALAWRATKGDLTVGASVKFQSTPSHGGRLHPNPQTQSPNQFQSTPLAWRATPDSVVDIVLSGVSIHALAWRATSPASIICMTEGVSIHALAWRATLDGFRQSLGNTGFNPRPRMEGDVQGWYRNPHWIGFQSTPSHGGRLGRGLQCNTSYLFQSTPSHGGRLQRIHCRRLLDWFQSTPSHGGRRRRICV